MVKKNIVLTISLKQKADIKPDNILVSENFAVVKLCDFGSAFFENDVDNDPTPYLVSRFYRPPEVILGLEYDSAVDLWSIACTLTELFTGNVLFPGPTNNAMLTLFMETMGPFSNKMVRRHVLSYERLQLQSHFTEGRGDYRFKKQEIDRVTGKPVLRIVPVTPENSSRSSKSISHLLLKSRSENDDRGDVLRFADLLNRCLALDPGRRMKVEETLRQDFIVSSSSIHGKRGKTAGGRTSSTIT